VGAGFRIEQQRHMIGLQPVGSVRDEGGEREGAHQVVQAGRVA